LSWATCFRALFILALKVRALVIVSPRRAPAPQRLSEAVRISLAAAVSSRLFLTKRNPYIGWFFGVFLDNFFVLVTFLGFPLKLLPRGHFESYRKYHLPKTYINRNFNAWICLVLKYLGPGVLVPIAQNSASRKPRVFPAAGKSPAGLFKNTPFGVFGPGGPIGFYRALANGSRGRLELLGKTWAF
jgi:hypothetical protein